MALDVISWVLSNSNTSNVLEGMGNIKGKNATISSITPINGGNQITFAYTLDDGTQQTSTLDILDAYGIALKNNFVGTEEEWLESLKMDVTELKEVVAQEVADQIGDTVEESVEEQIDNNLATEDLDFSGMF